MESQTHLIDKAKSGGWGRIAPGRYPVPLLWEWLKENHPEQLDEYKEWFDKEVRE